MPITSLQLINDRQNRGTHFSTDYWYRNLLIVMISKRVRHAITVLHPFFLYPEKFTSLDNVDFDSRGLN